MAIPSYSASLITAVKGVIQDQSLPKFVMGGRNASTYSMHKKTTTYSFALFRDRPRVIGSPFTVDEIRFTLAQPLAANMAIIPVLYFDGGASSSVGTTINTTNYPTANQRFFRLSPSNFASGTHGKNDFYLELQFTGSVLASIEPGVMIDVDIHNIP